ncbi:MAG: SAM-dependent DNA methyltransferase [Bacteroidaceae bacterium]|nr:SAM-dependent DNA methyltransferase [Bacteroidaceae bacterium]
MTDKQQQAAAALFAKEWEGRGYEKGESQPFWMALLHNVYGVEHAEKYISFENQVKLSNTSFIDGYIEQTHVLIEQKGLDKDLRKPIKQSDGSLLTPFQQAKRYADEMPYSRRPRWVVVCNFQSFLVYDMERPNSEPEEILLANLATDYYRLQFLVDDHAQHIKKEMEVSIKAGAIVGQLYDEILRQYLDPTSPATLRSLNVLCVRLVFCLYAEDAGVLGRHGMFADYLSRFTPDRMRGALIDLFRVLNTPLGERDPYMDEALAAFPYVNGGLFADDTIEIPRMNERIADLLIEKSGNDFDWSQISPTIFGAVFESTLNPETRRSGGMHYTSIENIHKVIDPLFMDALHEEYHAILADKVERSRQRQLMAFQDRLASLTFLDPACGSGNFLTETYLSLRRLENEVISQLHGGQAMLGAFVNPIKVGIHQFYGIEINDFAVTVATTALWIAEAQMMAETERIVHMDLDFLPLKSYTNIVEGNALRIDWNEVIPATKLNYIMGNPPFVGARWMNKDQKADVLDIFGSKWPGVGDLDYVSCWYKKASDLILGTTIKAALVSTNSISQGGAVTNLWKPLFDTGINIHFAWHTFRWDSEASIKAHVHCVIIGFCDKGCCNNRIIYLNELQSIEANNINGYLLDAPNIFIEKRQKPICDVPQICLGGQPIDDGNFILTEDDLVACDSIAMKYVRKFMMGKDFIDRKPRYCLWMKHINPSEAKQSPFIMERVKNVREFRLSSNRASTLKAADTPFLFGAPFECMGDYIALPKVSSENRRYIPIDYLSQDIIPGDKLFCMQGAGVYHFGILTSNVHMAWMRAVCGRLKSDYSYSNTIVYNNFPWPEVSEAQKAKIEQTAQAILDARALYPDSSLADLYDEVTMPPELRRAHQQNDRAVMEAYGFPVSRDFTESDCVARLFDMYKQLTQ